jgi:hypothetical protein
LGIYNIQKLTRSEEEKKTLQFKIDTMKGKITESEEYGYGGGGN